MHFPDTFTVVHHFKAGRVTARSEMSKILRGNHTVLVSKPEDDFRYPYKIIDSIVNTSNMPNAILVLERSTDLDAEPVSFPEGSTFAAIDGKMVPIELFH